MSTCPSKDIHSVYLDNELPEIYKAEYEEHLKNCPQCQKELEKIRALHKMFTSDSVSITPDATYLNQSFERLQMKMKFAKNTSRKSSDNGRKSYNRLGVISAAAAAVFALIIPLRLTGNSAVKESVTEALPITARNVSLNTSGNSGVISGNIDKAVLSSRRNSSANPFLQNVSSQANSENQNQFSFVHDGDVELLKPEFETISIKITLPGIDSVPVTTEVNLPVDFVSGRF